MTTILLVLTLAYTPIATAKHRNPRVETARTLNRGLAGTPMRGLGWKLEQAGWRWHIHPALIAAIAGTESSFGAASCRGNPFNAYGLSSCTSGWRVPYFKTWAQSFQFMGRFLTERWPRARTPYDYHGYAACSSCWGAKTSYYMRRLGFAPSVRYP